MLLLHLFESLATHIASLLVCDSWGAGVPHNSSDLGHHRPHGHHVYRIRIVGSEVVVPPIQYCGSIAVAKYSLSFPGSYHVEVLHMYNNFTFDRPSPVRSSIRAVDFNLLVNESPSGSSKSASPGLQKLSTSEHPGMSYVACQGTQCPICEVHSMPGRWLTKTAVVAQQLLHTCVFVDAPGHCDRRKSKLSLDESRQMLEWQPYGCSYKVQTAAMLTACMGKLNMPVCFIGDSQTRHLHRMVTRALCSVNCTNECAVQDNQAANGTTVKSVAKSDNVVYIEDRWGSLIDTSGCSYVFWNFGQWPLSYMARTAEDPTNLSWGEKPWSLQHYMAYVTPLAKHMVLQAQKHSNLHYWVTINSHPLTRDQQDPESRYHDQRTPPMLLMYNKLATTIMNQHAIEVVDTFSIADPLLDLSYDGAHYLGAIGQMQAQLVLNVVCEQQLLPTAVFPRIIDP